MTDADSAQELPSVGYVPNGNIPGGRPRLLDLFCGAGGAARGYQLAGFHVTGVDIAPQPNYVGDDFIQANALVKFYNGFDAIHASPPCQPWTAYGRRPGVGETYPDLIAKVRRLLQFEGLPYVIENVPGAPLREHVQLCGQSFGLEVRRHRWFETNWPLLVPPCACGSRAPRFPQATNRTNRRRTVEIGVWRIPLATQQEAMGIDWMTLPELSEAVPPAYTAYIGEQMALHMEQAA